MYLNSNNNDIASINSDYKNLYIRSIYSADEEIFADKILFDDDGVNEGHGVLDEGLLLQVRRA